MQTEKARSYSVFMVWLVVASAVIGMAFGFWGQQLYGGEMAPKHAEIPGWVGIALGAVLGSGTGLIYGIGLGAARKIFKSKWGIIVLGTIFGIVVAVGCSTVFHLILMNLFKCPSDFPLFISNIFNAGAGLLIGAVFSSIVGRKCK